LLLAVDENPLLASIYLSTSGNVGLGTINPTSNFQVKQGTGGIGTVNISGISITGTSTQFTNTFKIGDTITATTTNSVETRTIATIASDTSMTVSVAFT